MLCWNTTRLRNGCKCCLRTGSMRAVLSDPFEASRMVRLAAGKRRCNECRQGNTQARIWTIMATDVVIVGAARTAVGAFNGAFANTPAHELGAAAIKEALARAKVEAKRRQRGDPRPDPRRRSGPEPGPSGRDEAGIPQEATAWGLNQLCGSGLRAVALGLQQIANGDADVIVAGGMEIDVDVAAHRASAFRHQDGRHEVPRHDAARWPSRCLPGYHMGTTAENIATKWQISREEQDAFAAASQQKAEAAQKAGRFKDEIVPSSSPAARRHHRRSGRISQARHPPPRRSPS